MTGDLRSIADRLDILTLIGRVAQLADHGQVAAYAECFSEDAAWELTDATGLPLSEQVRRGRSEIIAGVLERREAGVQGPGSHTKHDISTIVVDLDGDTAVARTYFRYYRETHRTPELVSVGSYDDEFVRTPSGWKVTRRVIRRD